MLTCFGSILVPSVGMQRKMDSTPLKALFIMDVTFAKQHVVLSLESTSVSMCRMRCENDQAGNRSFHASTLQANASQEHALSLNMCLLILPSNQLFLSSNQAAELHQFT